MMYAVGCVPTVCFANALSVERPMPAVAPAKTKVRPGDVEDGAEMRALDARTMERLTILCAWKVRVTGLW